MTIEDLKKHCIETIKMSEAIESIPNVKITDSRRLQEHKMVLKLIEAWEKIRKEIASDGKSDINAKYVLNLIDKHLSEVSE